MTTGRILQPGSNCWALARADRFGIIVDAEAYFVAVKEAILSAREAVYLIGWDFDTRIKFEPRAPRLEGPNKLGRFLRWIGKRRPDLQIYVLRWDVGAIGALFRGSMPFRLLNLMTASNIHFQLDGVHPHGAAHHQKVVVIDDTLALCGGIDMTTLRWDTRDHLDEDDRRVTPRGRAYGPWHDATSIFDGPAARAMGELARDRWELATGERPAEPRGRGAGWPSSVRPLLTDVEVAIARTLPEAGERREVREIERLCLDAIAAARRTIYFESQYFASRRLAEAMAERLRDPDGPEIVVVNPLSADGFLEAKAMDTARARLLALVGEHDRHDRFRIYTPTTAGGAPIYVHAKILIVDDRLLRIGSSNLNNRSLGFDTECDVAIEAAADDHDGRRTAEAIAAVRADLLGEHLGVEPVTVGAALEAADGSLVAAVERLRGTGRTLVPYEPDPVGPVEGLIVESDLVDPERPRSLRQLLFGAG